MKSSDEDEGARAAAAAAARAARANRQGNHEEAAYHMGQAINHATGHSKLAGQMRGPNFKNRINNSMKRANEEG